MQYFNSESQISSFKWKPEARIISLVPSITELLFDLGLGPNIVGRTKFCVHPKKLLAKIPEVGGTKNIDIERIVSLHPDIVIANIEENSKNQILALQKKVYIELTHIQNYAQALQFIDYFGQIFQQQSLASSIVEDIRQRMECFEKEPTKSVLYFIWRNPYMSIGKNTFISSMLSQLGLNNVCSQMDGNYPILKEEDLQKLNPEIIFLSSEPYSFREIHKVELTKIFPQSKVFFVDGEMFSWYGSRMLKAADYFTQYIDMWKA